MKAAAWLVTHLLAIAAAACALPFGAGRVEAVRILVYNIHAGRDAAGRPNLEEVAALVRSTSADIVLLQEIDRRTGRSGGVDQLQVLGDRTRFAAAFGRTLDYDGGTYGIAALSRHGFERQETVPLPVSPVQTRAGGSHEPRAALVGVARTRLGRVRVVNTHLDASAGEEYRLQEAEGLLRVLNARATEDAIVLAGDMNAAPVSAVVKKLVGSGLRDAWAECGQGDGLTYPAHAPHKRIDYVFLGRGLRCTEARVLETTLSDHRPLLVTVRRW